MMTQTSEPKARSRTIIVPGLSFKAISGDTNYHDATNAVVEIVKRQRQQMTFRSLVEGLRLCASQSF